MSGPNSLFPKDVASEEAIGTSNLSTHKISPEAKECIEGMAYEDQPSGHVSR